MNNIAQQTLSGEVIPPRAPFSSLTPNELKIWNFLNSMQRGYTHDQIRVALASTGISTFENRLRELRAKGWVYNHEDSSGLLLWYAVPKSINSKKEGERSQDEASKRTGKE